MKGKKDASLLIMKMLFAWQMASRKNKINNSSTVESELWRNAGPSAFQLQETMLKSDKIWCRYLVMNCMSLPTFWTPLILSGYWPLPQSLLWHRLLHIRFMSRELGKEFGHFAESLLPHLILLIPNSVRVMSTSGVTAVRYIIRVSCSILSYVFDMW